MDLTFETLLLCNSAHARAVELPTSQR